MFVWVRPNTKHQYEGGGGWWAKQGLCLLSFPGHSSSLWLCDFAHFLSTYDGIAHVSSWLVLE